MTQMEFVKAANAAARDEGLTVSNENMAIMFQAVINTLASALEKHERIAIAGFGTFQTEVKAERQGHNPKTGAKMTIPAKTVVVFKPAGKLKERVNQISR